MFSSHTLFKSPIYENGHTKLWPTSLLKRAAGSQMAIALGNINMDYAPRHLARNPNEAMRIIEAYQSISRRFGWHCLFRGQCRDYFTRNKLVILPSSMRSIEHDYTIPGSGSALIAETNIWRETLNQLGIRVDNGSKFRWHHPQIYEFLRHGWDTDYEGSDSTMLMINNSSLMLRNNPLFAAILQHYGFPTDHLDLTRDPNIALWFALHRTDASSVQSIRYLSISSDEIAETFGEPEGPSCYVFIHPPFSKDHDEAVLDLARLDMLKMVTFRATRQSALSKPCSQFLWNESHKFPIFMITRQLMYPTAVIKLGFSFDATSLRYLTCDYLFPRNDKLYRRLKQNGARHLAVYG